MPKKALVVFINRISDLPSLNTIPIISILCENSLSNIIGSSSLTAECQLVVLKEWVRFPPIALRGKDVN